MPEDLVIDEEGTLFRSLIIAWTVAIEAGRLILKNCSYYYSQ